MKKLLIIIIITLLLTLSSCSGDTGNKLNYDVVSNNVTIWEDSSGEKYIILAVEVTNLSEKALYFKESDFDIVDESGTVVVTMKSASAYPPVVEPGEIAVYYDVITCDKTLDASTSLKVIPHIEAEITDDKYNKLYITGVSGGGSKYAGVIVKNSSSKTVYNNVHIAIISRTQSNDVVSVMTAIIDSIKPGEEKEIEAEDHLIERDLGPNVVTNFSYFAYLDPMAEVSGWSFSFRLPWQDGEWTFYKE